MSTGELDNTSAPQAAATREAPFIQLGNLKISPLEIVQGLIGGGQWAAIDQVLNAVLTSRAFKERSVHPDQEQVAKKIVAFRKENGLTSAQDMHAWMAKHCLTDAGLISMCSYQVSVELLKESLFGDSIEKFFELRRLQLDSVEIYRIITAREEAAKEMVAAIREDNASFFDFARRYSTDTKTNMSCGYQGIVPVSTLAPQVQESIADSSEGALIGPVKVLKHFEIILVHKFHKAILDAATREKLMQELFEQWLSETKARNPVALHL